MKTLVIAAFALQSVLVQAQKLPDPMTPQWTNASERARDAVRAEAEMVYAVYLKGAKGKFASTFEVCEKRIAAGIQNDANEVKKSASGVSSKKQAVRMLEEGNAAAANQQLLARAHCLNRLMIAMDKLNSGLISPSFSDWLESLKAFDFEDLTAAGVASINDDLGEKHEDFMQRRIQLVRLTAEERAQMKRTLHLSDEAIEATGMVRLDKYVKSFQETSTILTMWSKEFGCITGDKTICK